MPYADPDVRREFQQRYYQEHREILLPRSARNRLDNLDRVRANDLDRQRKSQQWFVGNLNHIKHAQGCSDCGARDGRLCHHHIDPATKRYNVSKMHRQPVGLFIDEISKCAVLCVSCHTKHHAALRRAASCNQIAQGWGVNTCKTS